MIQSSHARHLGYDFDIVFDIAPAVASFMTSRMTDHPADFNDIFHKP